MSRGQTIIVVLIFIATSTILGAAFFSYLSQGITLGGREVSQEKALQLAEAGLNRAFYELNSSSSWSGLGETSLGEGTYRATVTTIDSTSRKIEATGFVPNAANPKAKRTLRVIFTLSPGAGPFKYGVQTGTGGMEINTNAIIHGNVYSNANVACYQGSQIEGDAFAAGTFIPNNPPTCVQGTYQASSTPRPLPEFDPDFWHNAANTNPSPGCPTSGPLEYNGGTNTLGPCQVNGSLTLNGSAKLIMKGPIYVTGNFEMNSESQLILDDSFGTNGTVLLADGIIKINANSKIFKAASSGIIRPDADFTSNWQVTPSGPHYNALDEIVEAPTAGDTTDYVSSATNNQLDEFDMTALSKVASTTNITIFAYARTSGDDNLGVNLVIDGTPQTEQVLGLTTIYSWVNATFTLTLSQGQLDSLRIRLREDRAGSQNSVSAAALYAKVRYYPVGAGNIMLVSATTTDPAIELNSQADGGIFYALNDTIRVNANSHPVALTGVKVVINSDAQIFYDEGLADQAFTSGPGAGWSVKRGSWFISE